VTPLPPLQLLLRLLGTLKTLEFARARGEEVKEEEVREEEEEEEEERQQQKRRKRMGGSGKTHV
jgi:hypothetical protein